MAPDKTKLPSTCTSKQTGTQSNTRGRIDNTDNTCLHGQRGTLALSSRFCGPEHHAARVEGQFAVRMQLKGVQPAHALQAVVATAKGERSTVAQLRGLQQHPINWSS